MGRLGSVDMRETVVVGMALALIVTGCGGGDDSSYTRDDIASALGFSRHAHETIYEMAPGKDCIVLRVLTTSDEVEAAQRDAGTALAVSSDGNAGVLFAGFGDLSQDECVAPAESDLDTLSK